MRQAPILIIILITLFFQSCVKEGANEIDKKAFYGYPYIPVKDIDGNEYKTVKIGKQIWMAENYKATRLNDSTTIAKRYFYGNIDPLLIPWYCWPYDDSNTYRGVYYSWYVVNTEKLCPVGWHVPNDSDWFELINYLGGRDVAGGKLKSNTNWIGEENKNISGFNAKPSGAFDGYGSTTACYLWSSSEKSDSTATVFLIFKNADKITFWPKEKISGISVRCVKD